MCRILQFAGLPLWQPFNPASHRKSKSPARPPLHRDTGPIREGAPIAGRTGKSSLAIIPRQRCQYTAQRAHLEMVPARVGQHRSEEHTSELQSLMRISYAVFCLKKKKQNNTKKYIKQIP